MATSYSTSTPNTKKHPRIGSNTCPKCETTIKENTDHLSCSVCELMYCIQCTNISKILVEALKEDTTNNFKWTCNGCKQNFPCMATLTNQLKSIEEKTDTRIRQIENKIQNITKSIEQKVNSGIQDVTPTLVDKIKKDIRVTLQDDVRKEMREIEDQKRRTLNLVIFHLPESRHSDPVHHKQEDELQFFELCNHIGVDKPDVKTIFRLGNQTQGKTRAATVILNNKAHRKTILDNVSKIKDLPKSTGLSRCINSKSKGIE